MVIKLGAHVIGTMKMELYVNPTAALDKEALNQEDNMTESEATGIFSEVVRMMLEATTNK